MRSDMLLAGYVALFLCFGLFKGYALTESRKLRKWHDALESWSARLDSRENR